MFRLDVNDDSVVALTDKLESLSSTAFPNAVRKTLNDTAMDVKKRTLEASASKNFTRRDKNFFKRFSRVNFVSEKRNVNAMQSEVGMWSRGLMGGENNYAVKNLEQQEQGGTIRGRSLIPTDSARISSKRDKKVRARDFISKNRANIKKARGVKKKDWVAAARAAGVGGYVMGTFKPLVFRVTSINRFGVKMVPVYYHNPTGTVNVKATHFAKEAAIESSKKLPFIYMKVAQKRFERSLR